MPRGDQSNFRLRFISCCQHGFAWDQESFRLLQNWNRLTMLYMAGCCIPLKNRTENEKNRF